MNNMHELPDAPRLPQVDLTESEREELASAIAVLARARETAQDFDGCASVPVRESVASSCLTWRIPTHVQVRRMVQAARAVRYHRRRRERGYVQAEFRELGVQLQPG